MFGDDDDDDTEDQVSVIDHFCNEAFIEIMRLRPFLKRQLDDKAELIMPRCIGILICKPIDEETWITKFVNRLKVAKFDKVEVIYLNDINADQLSLCTNGIEDHDDETALGKIFPLRSKSPSSYQYDALIIYDIYNELIAKIATYMVIAGGLLLCTTTTACVTNDSEESVTTAATLQKLLNRNFGYSKCSTSTSNGISPPNPTNIVISSSCHNTNNNNFLCLKRKYIQQNVTATPYWSPNVLAEALLLEKITVCLSVAERRLQLFSDVTQQRATECLKTHGLVIFKGLYDKHRVMYWGDCAKKDMTQVIWKLRERGIDLLKNHDDNDNDNDDDDRGNGDVDIHDSNMDSNRNQHRQKRQTKRSQQPVQMIENYHEMSMREARRCDLRNGYAMKQAAVLADQQLNNTTNGAAAVAPVVVVKDESTIKSLDVDIRHHQGIMEVISSTAHSMYYSNGTDNNKKDNRNNNTDEEEEEEDSLPLYRGNWGRWNFEGQGPDGPPASLVVGQVGAVMSMPGCVDQTIHADTSHIFTHTQLPGHYFNFFLPAATTATSPIPIAKDVDNRKNIDDDDDDVYAKGQTAFVLNSHLLSVAYAVMVAETGADTLNELLVRPHLNIGDGLVFDCRILHLGLANRYHINNNTGVNSTRNNIIDNHASSRSNNNNNNNNNNSTNYTTANTTTSSSSSSSSSVALDTSGWRPMLYINYHQPWFIDPKNWNNNEKLFEAHESSPSR